MKALLTIARKDLKLLARNKAAFFWVLGFPILLALFFGAIQSGGSGSKRLPIAIVDLDRSAYSRGLIERLEKSDALRVRETTLDSARTAVRRGDLSAYVALPEGIGEFFGFGGDSTRAIEIGIDPRQSATAEMVRGLVTKAIFEGLRGSFTAGGSGRELVEQTLARMRADSTKTPEARARSERVLHSLESFMTTIDSVEVQSGRVAAGPAPGPDSVGVAAGPGPGLDSVGVAAGPAPGPDSSGAAAATDDGGTGGPQIRMTEITGDENEPRTAYEITFPSSLAWALIGVCMSFAVSIVYERVTGTFLRLRLAPLSRGQVLAGKGLACFLACLGSVAFLLALGIFGFHIRVTNPLGLAVTVLAAAFCFTGLMMLIASLGRSHQSVSGAGWAAMLVMAMTGGGMIPLIAMPEWMQRVSNFSLVKWAVLGAEGAIWRGFGWREMALPIGVLAAAGLISLVVGARVLARAET